MLVKLGSYQINTEHVVLVMPSGTARETVGSSSIGQREGAKSLVLLSGGEVLCLPEAPDVISKFLNLGTESAFEEALNNMVAPVTRAWLFERIVSAAVAPEDMSKDEPEFVVRIAVKRKK